MFDLSKIFDLSKKFALPPLQTWGKKTMLYIMEENLVIYNPITAMGFLAMFTF
jgi:hypothetical protein